MAKSKLVSMMAVVLCAAMAQANTRADLSGDAVVRFQTTMDMPFMHVGNPGNADDTHGSGYGGVDYEYNIGKFEVTAGQYTEFLNAVGATDTYGIYIDYMGLPAGTGSGTSGCNIQRSGSSGSYTYSVAADWEDRPVNHISWTNSARFANWLTNGMPTGVQDLTTTEGGSYLLNGATGQNLPLALPREAGARYVIPSEDEWYKAAYHKNDGATGNYFDYPTSSDVYPSNRYHYYLPDEGNNANLFHNVLYFSIGPPYLRTEVGDFENSESPYGTFDQAGNVQEWNEAPRGGLRGGSYSAYQPGSVNASSRHVFMYGWPAPGNTIGLRLAEVPEPATMSLLALGGLAMLRRRQK